MRGGGMGRRMSLAVAMQQTRVRQWRQGRLTTTCGFESCLPQPFLRGSGSASDPSNQGRGMVIIRLTFPCPANRLIKGIQNGETDPIKSK
jgi:hypothetical protein